MKICQLFFIGSFFFLLPFMARAELLTDADVNRYIRTYPHIHKVLVQVIKRLNQDKDLESLLAMAQTEGRGHRAMLGLIDRWPEQREIESIVKRQGYSSLYEWGLVADRISGVMMASSWVMGAASMGGKPLRDDMNLFAYINDHGNSPELRKKYRQQLNQMCSRLCYDRGDIDPVSKRYADITSVFK